MQGDTMPIQAGIAMMERPPFLLRQRMDEQLACETAAREEERLRIAQELHDTCIQAFLAVSMHLRTVAFECSGNSALQSRIERLAQMALDAVEEGRCSVNVLRSPVCSLPALDA